MYASVCVCLGIGNMWINLQQIIRNMASWSERGGEDSRKGRSFIFNCFSSILFIIFYLELIIFLMKIKPFQNGTIKFP